MATRSLDIDRERAPAAVVASEATPLMVDRSACKGPCSPWQRLLRATFARSDVLKSVAFRIAATFWLLFNLCLAIGGYYFYVTMQERVLDRVDQSLVDRAVAIRLVQQTEGLDGVIRIARGKELLPMQSSMGFHLAAPDGRMIAGNVEVAPPATRWSIVRGDSIGMPEAGSHSYRFLTVPLGDNLLSLGKSLDALEELRSVASRCLLLTFVVSTLLAVAIAAWIASRMRRRMEGWSDALDRIAGGNLATRLPVSPVEDGIDEMALTVNAALERLQRNIDTMRQVSTDIAHDLKTPLNRLYIHLEEALSDVGRLGQVPGVASLETSLEQAVEEAQQINGTFEALLRVAQIEGGARRTKFAHFDLAEVLSTTAEVYEAVIEEYCEGLTTGFDRDHALPMYGDRELVLQLVVNLVENAIHHCREGSASGGLIEIGGGEVDGNVYLYVGDHGPGIPEAEREKVFQRLYRLERSRTTRGTGLGLSLVKAIADLHCGHVVLADNLPGLRATVHFDRDCPTDSPRTRHR